MTKRIEIIEETEVFKQAIFRVVAATLKFELYDGTMSDKLVRLNLDRGDSVAALIHDVQNDVLLMTEQFRYPTHEKGPGWLTEIVAGMVDTDEAPADSMRREIWEEVGYRVSSLQHIGTFYLSPGGSSERIHLYYSAVDQADRGSSGGGELSEGEDVLVMKMPVDQALEELDRGRIMDAKTMIALQWLALNRDTL
jgi:nudix-type nucleoside diphosphatase (YffH/AdpP family)